MANAPRSTDEDGVDAGWSQPPDRRISASSATSWSGSMACDRTGDLAQHGVGPVGAGKDHHLAITRAHLFEREVAVDADRLAKAAASHVADDPDDLAPDQMLVDAGVDAAPDRVLTREQLLCGCLADDRNGPRAAIVGGGEVPPAKERDLHGLEVAGCDGVDSELAFRAPRPSGPPSTQTACRRRKCGTQVVDERPRRPDCAATRSSALR